MSKKDWPQSIAPKAVFLRALSKAPHGLTTRDLHQIARDNIPGGYKPNPYTGTNAIRALVGCGTIMEHPERHDVWLVRPPEDAQGNRAFTGDEITAACLSLGIDHAALIGVLMGEKPAAPAGKESPPEDFSARIEAARALLPRDEKSAITLDDFRDLCEARGIVGIDDLMEQPDVAAAIMAGTVAVLCGGKRARYLPRAEPQPAAEDPADDLAPA